MSGAWAAGPYRKPLTLRLRDAVSIAWTTLLLVAFVAPAIPVLLGYELMIVTSGSMAPELNVADIAIIDDRAPEGLGGGDVITFRPIGDHTLTTHRIVARRWVQGRLYFQTKGDANETPDPNLAPAASTLGRLVASVPGYGFLLEKASTPIGRLALLGPPAALILIREIGSLGAHRRRRLIRRDLSNGEGGRIGTDGTLSARRVLPSVVLAALVTFVTWAAVSTLPTSARFVDTSTVTGNVFATATQFT